MERLLIVNADDFGRSHGTNAGVARGHEQGVVTSASLMVNWPSAAEAAAYARSHPELSVGLHVDLGEWSYQDGEWRQTYVAKEPIEAAVHLQLSRFETLVGRSPSHIDSHQHVHETEPARSLLAELTTELRVPLRNHHPQIRYCGAFYGQTGKGERLENAITVGALTALLEDLPPGVTELACHPAAELDFDTTYGHERILELNTLCDPDVAAAVERLNITLISFGHFAE